MYSLTKEMNLMLHMGAVCTVAVKMQRQGRTEQQGKDAYLYSLKGFIFIFDLSIHLFFSDIWFWLLQKRIKRMKGVLQMTHNDIIMQRHRAIAKHTITCHWYSKKHFQKRAGYPMDMDTIHPSTYFALSSWFQSNASNAASDEGKI